LAVKRLLLILPFLVQSCSYVSANRDGFRAYMPVYPWQDSTRLIERMSVSTGTNRFTASVRGLSETDVTSTNAVHLIEAVTKGAMEGAVKALVKP